MLVLTIILVIHEIAEVDLLQARIAWFVYLVSISLMPVGGTHPR